MSRAPYFKQFNLISPRSRGSLDASIEKRARAWSKNAPLVTRNATQSVKRGAIITFLDWTETRWKRVGGRGGGGGVETCIESKNTASKMTKSWKNTVTRNLESFITFTTLVYILYIHTIYIYIYFSPPLIYHQPVSIFQRKMTSLDDHVMVDNLEYATSIISRVGNLRKVLRELRNALREERLNLHQEIEMTILQKFIDLQRKYDSLAGYLFPPL